MNFINVVECCLQQILHDLGTLVNTASAKQTSYFVFICILYEEERIQTQVATQHTYGDAF